MIEQDKNHAEEMMVMIMMMRKTKIEKYESLRECKNKPY
jgi:hypothetical protein